MNYTGHNCFGLGFGVSADGQEDAVIAKMDAALDVILPLEGSISGDLTIGGGLETLKAIRAWSPDFFNDMKFERHESVPRGELVMTLGKNTVRVDGLLPKDER